jgi:hypothetical protein
MTGGSATLSNQYQQFLPTMKVSAIYAAGERRSEQRYARGLWQLRLRGRAGGEIRVTTELLAA